MATPEEIQAYLEEVLGLDPVHELGHIVELRDRFHGPAAPGGDGRTHGRTHGRGGKSADQTSTPREEAMGQIAAIREVFWDADESRMGAALDEVRADAFPDLERALHRLRLVNELRFEVEALGNSSAVRREYLDALKAVLVGTAKDAADARDQLARRLGTKARASQAKPLVKAIEKHAPGIADLESDWLVRLRGAKKERRDSRVVGGLGCFGAYLAFSGLRALVKLIMQWMESS